MDIKNIAIGILLTIAGLITLILTIRYLVKEYKNEERKKRVWHVLDVILDIFWFHINFSTIFLLTGIVSLILGIFYILIELV
ncbi:hypothetical protein [Bacillus suaedaesalsae]|uniref:Uncharacterized protein n=1 Tax=Bacillus suaedaesalsae TaxID=2810349 RepID=A0ABS2DME5_9BACI|nr:hypothetical protein [Bacillus suaedaesalsae]MBM6619658.1 hypothetical protein [Bacillus suaedaesalsae]